MDVCILDLTKLMKVLLSSGGIHLVIIGNIDVNVAACNRTGSQLTTLTTVNTVCELT